jgi:CRP/FNR family transcriptional regulator, cyclic AMP receptor protein
MRAAVRRGLVRRYPRVVHRPLDPGGESGELPCGRHCSRSLIIVVWVRTMTTESLSAPLLRVPIFSGLAPEQIQGIARRAERMTFRSGEFITRAGEPGGGAYLLVSGDAACVDGDGLATADAVIEPGSLIGELAMLVEHTYGTTVVARERVHCLKIMRFAMHNQMLTDPSLAEHLSRQITARLVQVAEDLRRIDHTLVPSQAHTAHPQALAPAPAAFTFRPQSLRA